MPTKDKAVKSGNKFNKGTKSKISNDKHDLYDNKRKKITESSGNNLFCDDLLDEILSKWQG
jgi:hypothetical protein